MEDPVPAGTWAGVGAVDIVVLANEPDATDLVLAENEFNTAPEPGNRFVMWRVAVANGGEQTTPLLAEVSFAVAGPSTVVYNTSANCGVIPAQLDEFRDVFPGGTVEGNLRREVADEDAESLVLLVDEFAFSSDRMIFASAGTKVPLTVDYPTPVPPETDGPVGTRGNPYPLGETITVGEWDVTVTDVAEDATAEVLAENSFNEVPPDGRQFLMIGIEATYNEDASTSCSHQPRSAPSGLLPLRTPGRTRAAWCRARSRSSPRCSRAERWQATCAGRSGPKTSAASSSTPRKP